MGSLKGVGREEMRKGCRKEAWQKEERVERNENIFFSAAKALQKATARDEANFCPAYSRNGQAKHGEDSQHVSFSCLAQLVQ